MLKRKIYDSLVAWKHRSCGKTSLLIDGARRVGKSYIAEQFAKNEYKSYIIVDFGNLCRHQQIGITVGGSRYLQCRLAAQNRQKNQCR